MFVVLKFLRQVCNLSKVRLDNCFTIIVIHESALVSGMVRLPVGFLANGSFHSFLFKFAESLPRRLTLEFLDVSG